MLCLKSFPRTPLLSTLKAFWTVSHPPVQAVSCLSHPTSPELKTELCPGGPSKLNNVLSLHIPLDLRSSPRPISTSQLSTSRYLHPWPINLVVFKGSYHLNGVGYLVLGSVSRLDAFSVYPFRTWLLSRAFGKTTDTPAVRPSRSSRTKDSTLQISCARDR